MIFVVSSIGEVSVKKIALWISVHVDDRTAERAIIASNAEQFKIIFCLLVQMNKLDELLANRRIPGEIHHRRMHPSLQEELAATDPSIEEVCTANIYQKSRTGNIYRNSRTGNIYRNSRTRNTKPDVICQL